MPRLFKKSHKYNVARNCFLARIVLLDKTTIEFNLLPEVTGADCLEKVAQVMEIQEISYFGLQYQTKRDSLRWVDKEKPLRKQLEKHAIDGARNAELRFRVQYYVANITKLKFEITRYLYYLQLKHLILNGELECSNDLAVKLASYALQGEFGNFDDQKHTDEFLSDYIFLPPHIGPPSVIQSLTDRASKLHQRHRDVTPAAAELMYIKLAQQLPEYGHQIFQKLDVNGSTIWLGACFIGIFVKHSNGQPNIYFKWPDIYRMKVRDKNFGVETPGETIYFKMPDNKTAQYVLKMMISQHKFYRAELEEMPGLSWMANGAEGTKKKSRSLHDLRTRGVTPEPSHHQISTSLFANYKRTKRQDSTEPMQRPLHRGGVRGASAEPRPPTVDTTDQTSRDPPIQLVSIRDSTVGMPRDSRATADSNHSSHPTTNGISPNGAVATSAQSTVANRSEPTQASSPAHTSSTNSTPSHTTHSSPPHSTPSHLPPLQRLPSHHAKKPEPLVFSTEPLPPSFFTNSEDFIDWVDPEVSGDGGSQVGGDRNSQTSQPSSNGTPKNSPFARRKGKNKRHKNGLPTGGSMDIEDHTDSSQETFEMLGGARKKKLTGSLDQLNSRTPPRSLKIRTFSIAEQQEQEAPSGTRDQRGAELEKVLNSSKLYTEYETLPKKKAGANTDMGQLPENIHKNRYRDILPYEETRVKLDPANNASGNDYINASYVKFTVNQKPYNYVVAQGPLEHTCADFWQMIWEQKVHVVIMVTNEMEDCRSKCYRYFPPDEKVEGKPDYVQFEQYRVCRTFVEKSSTSINRVFQVKHIPSGQEREVTHLQYIDWPDYGIPEDPQPFLDFLAGIGSLRHRYDSSYPMLVHCSAGVGRSGVVVLMDQLIAKVDCGDVIDIPKSLKELRSQRMHLVQMVGQYKFVYSAIIQYIGRARLI